MAIKDIVVGLYVKNYLMPRAQIIDKPGFVVFNVTGKTPIFARQMIFPELFFILLEKKLIEGLGNEGKRILYSVGKKFGIRFSLMGNFSKRGEIPDKKIPDYINMINKFIEGTYASDISCEPDVNNSKVIYHLKNFVVCSKDGYGFFLPLGAGCGLIAYLLNDETIEGVHLECQGDGKEKCKLLYEPINKLKLDIKDKPIFKETDLKGLEFTPDYGSMNAIKETESSKYSFQQFIDSNIFSFNAGIIMNGDQRYFIYEVSGIYMLERELQKSNVTKKILGEIAYETGKRMLLNYKGELSLESLIDLLTAFGWGDVLILEKASKYVVNIKYFPWTEFSDEVEFITFQRMIAGMLSIISKREVKFKRIEKDSSQGYLSLVFAE